MVRIRVAALLLTVVLIGAPSALGDGERPLEPDPNHAPAGTPAWDMRYLMNVDPRGVSAAGMARYADWVERNYQRHHQVDGITWVGYFGRGDTHHPSLYGDGGDSALFTSLYLAAAVWRYQVTRDWAHLMTVLETLRGIHILTHVSGTPGVLARCAFPIALKEHWRYPEWHPWKARLAEGHMYVSQKPVADVLEPGRPYPQMVFHTRTSKDQLTGVLFGLAVLWRELRVDAKTPDPISADSIQWARQITAGIVRDLWRWIRWNPNTGLRLKVVDHTGKSGKSRVWKVEGVLRLQLMLLVQDVYRETGNDRYVHVRNDYRKVFDRTFPKRAMIKDLIAGRLNNVEDYFAHHLRLLRFHTLLTLEAGEERRRRMEGHMMRGAWWPVKHHANTHFTFLYNDARNNRDEQAAALHSLKALSLRPLRAWSSPLHDQDVGPNSVVRLFGSGREGVVPVHLRSLQGYFIWEKPPWFVLDGLDKNVDVETTGLAFLAPYWLGRARGYVPAP